MTMTTETTETKKCSCCKQDLPVSAFGKNKSKKDGLQSYCKTCYKARRDDPEAKAKRAAYLRQYRKDNAERIKAKQKQWRQNNAEAVKEYYKQYYKDNAEARKEYVKQYYKDNAEARKAYAKQHREDNIEAVKEYKKQYRANLPAGVYRIVCSATGQMYIGSSNALPQRSTEHYRDLRKGVHCNKALQAAYDAHGKDAFTFEVMEVYTGSDREELYRIEQRYIDKGANLYNTYDASSRGSE